VLKEYYDRYQSTQLDIERQAGEQRQRLESEAEERRRKLAEQEAGIIADIEKQQSEAEAKVRVSISEMEVSRQSAAQKLRTAERQEQRKRAGISLYTPTDLRTTEQLLGLEDIGKSTLGKARIVREDILSQVGKSKTEVAKQKAESLLDIDKALQNALGQLDTEKRQAIESARQQYESQSAEFESSNIRLGDGTWVDRKEWNESFNKLDTELADKYKDIGLTKGINAMNKALEDDKAEFVNTHVEIQPNQWVDRNDWDKLTVDQQTEFRTTGKYTITNTPATGDEALKKLIDSGDAPIGSTLLEYNKETGTVRFQPPSINIPITDTSGITEGLPEEQVTTIEVVELDTPSGKVQMPKDDWDKMPDTKKLETSLGRIPTLAEYQYYQIDKQLIQSQVMNQSDVDAYFRSQPFSTVLGEVTRIVPGTQYYEALNNVMGNSEDEWGKAYPDMYLKGVGITSLEMMGLSASKALYPQISVKEIKGSEWVSTGLGIGMLTAPLWLPKVVSVVKTPVEAKLSVITPDILKTEFQKTYTIAKEAGQAKTAMDKAIQVVKNTEVNNPNYFKYLQDSADKTRTSITADLKFTEKFSVLEKIDTKQLKAFEKASQIDGLTDATNEVIRTRKAFDNALQEASNGVVDDALRARLSATRQAFTDALDRFGEITQPRAIDWRVPTQERIVWAESTVTPYTVQKPINPSVQALFDQINEWNVTHLKPTPESKGGVATAVRPITVKPIPEFEIKTKVSPPEVAGISKAEVPATAKAPSPKPITKPSPFVLPAKPTTTPTEKPRTREITGGDTEQLPSVTSRPITTESEVTEIKEFTPDIIKEAELEAVKGKPIIEVDTNLKQKMIDITKDASIYVRELKAIGLEDIEIRNSLREFIKNKINSQTNEQLRNQLRQVSQEMIETALQTQAITATTTETKIGIEKQVTTTIPTPIPTITGKGEQWPEDKKIPPATITWKMGEPKGAPEGMWNIFPYPYERLYYSTKEPEGVLRRAKGKGSAKETLQVIGGEIPSDFDLDTQRDIGATLLNISIHGGVADIDFDRDPEDAYKGKSEEVTVDETPLKEIVEKLKIGLQEEYQTNGEIGDIGYSLKQAKEYYKDGTGKIDSTIKKKLKTDDDLILYGAQAVNMQLPKYLHTPTEDWDITTESNPETEAKDIERALDKRYGHNYFEVIPAVHKGTYRVRSIMTGDIVADISISDKDVPYKSINGIKVATLDYQVSNILKSLSDKESQFRHTKDLETLQRILIDEGDDLPTTEAPIPLSIKKDTEPYQVVESYIRHKKNSNKNWWDSPEYQNITDTTTKKVKTDRWADWVKYRGGRLLPPQLGEKLK